MTLPKIVGSSERKVHDKAPPEKERIKPHKWLSNASLQKYIESEPNGFDLYLSKLAEEKKSYKQLRNDFDAQLLAMREGSTASGKDEVGELARVFNHMAERLGQTGDRSGQRYKRCSSEQFRQKLACGYNTDSGNRKPV
ncbi:MAG: HAMP domain-containing protein, partial [Methanomassiliicoccales archaeon]